MGESTMGNIAFPCSVATRESFKKQVLKAFGKEMSVSQAIWKALRENGYDLPEIKRTERGPKNAIKPNKGESGDGTSLAAWCPPDARDSLINQVAERGAKRGFPLRVSEAVREALVASGYDLSDSQRDCKSRGKNITIPCSAEVRKSLKEQVAKRYGNRPITLAQAMRETLVGSGYDLSEPKS